jgi:hypothetical protein
VDSTKTRPPASRVRITCDLAIGAARSVVGKAPFYRVKEFRLELVGGESAFRAAARWLKRSDPTIITVMSGLAAPDRQRHWLSALAAEVIAALAPGPKWFLQRQAGGARDSNSDLWSYLENLSSADRALEEKVIELAASYAASVTGADDNPKIIGYGRRSSDHCGHADWRSMMLTAILLSLAYMVFNEWLNVRDTPELVLYRGDTLLTPLGTGLAPFPR